MRTLAAADPVSFLSQHPGGLLATEEVQLVPSLMLALKLVVDRDPRPGRFLVTGSAHLLRLPATEDSLAGRVEGIELHGFSRGELTGHREQFIDRLLAGDRFVGHPSDLTRHDYLERAIAGAYPEALARPAGRRRSQWLDNYLTRVVERDAPDISTSQRLSDLPHVPHVLRLLAARNGEELNVASLASAAGIPTRSLAPLLDLLETLYLIQRIPAWSTNLSKRVVSRPKAMLLERRSGGAAGQRVRGRSGPWHQRRGRRAPTRGFVAGELRRQLPAQRQVRAAWEDLDPLPMWGSPSSRCPI